MNAGKDETDQAKLFDIVVCQVRSCVLQKHHWLTILNCQVDHRIVCDPWVDASSGNSASVCNTTKSVRPVARCNGFKADVWKAGATCIANLAHKDKHVQCGQKVSPADLIASTDADGVESNVRASR